MRRDRTPLCPPAAVSVSSASLPPPTRLSKPPLASPAPPAGRPAAPEGCEDSLGALPPSSGPPASAVPQGQRTSDEAPGSAGDCFCLGPGGGCVRASRAPARRSLSQSRVTRAPSGGPRSYSVRAGSFPLPVLGSRARTPPRTLHEFHASGCSSAPVPESAPATSRASALSLSLPTSLSLLPSRRLGSPAPQSAPGPCGLAPPPPRAPRPSSPPPGRPRGRAPRLRPSRGPARSRRGLSPTQATERPAASRRWPALLALPGRPRSRALRGERAPGPRAPGSGFSGLLSVR